MKKLFTLFILSITSIGFAQTGSSVIFDTTPYGIRSFHTFDIDGTNQKIVYLQQGMIQDGSGTTGGNVYLLKTDRTNWEGADFLNSLCCAAQNKCYPIDYLAVSRTDPSIRIFNGIFQCTTPGESGDYTKITYDGGITQNILPFKGVDTIQQCRGFDISKENSDIMYMAHNYFNNIYYSEPRIFKSTNGGADWFVTDTLQGMKPVSHSVTPDAGFLKALTWNQNYVFTSTTEHLAYSLEGGYNFQIRTDVPPLKMIVFDEGDWWIHGVAYDNRIFCNNGTITNNWIPASNPFNILCIEIDPDNHMIWYAGSENSGVWKSVNAGVTFQPYNNSFTPSKKVIGISKDSGSGDTIIVSTDKKVYKVWQSLLVSTETNETSIPENFSLSQNYPNPFNPNTIINYLIPSNVKGQTSNVKITVYDAQGKEIETLVNEQQNPGNYSVEFDGSNFSSGIYFYKLVTPDFSETKRMALIK